MVDHKGKGPTHHLSATHMGAPFPTEPGRCPVPFFFSCRDTWGVHHRRSRALPRTVLDFLFPTGNSTVSPAHESDKRLEPLSREAGSGGGHPACVGSKEWGSLTASLPHQAHSWHSRGPASCPAPGHHKAHPQPPICHQQLFMTGVPLSAADGDQSGPVGRRHMAPPSAHADVFTDTQISLHSVLRYPASGCRCSQAPLRTLKGSGTPPHTHTPQPDI